MSDLAAPLIFAALFWWLSTGVILWLIGLNARTFKWTASGAALVLALSTLALLALRDDVSVMGAYAGFTVGVLLWGWHETMFLLGLIRGPRTSPCPPGLSTWSRFVASTQTVIHHELAIAVHAVLIAALSWGAANQFAAWTFFLLWGMRISAKLVVFFGAPNVADSFLPSHMSYLATYFGRRATTVFFPVAIIVVTSAAAALAYLASLEPLGSFQSVGFLLLAMLAALAVVEHWALVVPLPDTALWAWAMRDRDNKGGRPDQFTSTEKPSTDAVGSYDVMKKAMPHRREQ